MIKSLLFLNSQKENSFKLNYSVIETLVDKVITPGSSLYSDNKFKSTLKNEDEDEDFNAMILTEDQLTDIFMKNEKEKLFDFRIDIMTD